MSGMELLRTFRIQCMAVAAVSLIVYGNTLGHDYAFDDSIVILKNEYVHQGFSGIPEIFSSDAYESYYRQMNAEQELSGGRYRPLSIAMFAAEQSLFGGNPFARHLIQVILYIISALLMLSFLRLTFFRNNTTGALVLTLFFVVHPLHTEVVANVKSRDEILSLVFILITLNHAVRFCRNPRFIHLLIIGISFFLALLSKEYGATLVILIPALLFLSEKAESKKIAGIGMILLLLFAAYLLLRISIVGLQSVESKEILNNPYIHATGAESFATKLIVMGKYLLLLVFPWPLSYDYSFAEIRMSSPGDPVFLISFAAYTALTAWTVFAVWKRRKIAFALLFFGLNAILVSNFFFNIGAPMGERLMYHASFGFLLFAGISLDYILSRRTQARTFTRISNAAICLLILVFGFMTIIRNFDWKDERTLFLADAGKISNSVIVNGNAGMQYILIAEESASPNQKEQHLNKAISYLKKATSMHPGYVAGLINLGIAQLRLKNFEEAEKAWAKARRLYPTHPNLADGEKFLAREYYLQGLSYAEKGNMQDANRYILKATRLDPAEPGYHFHLGATWHELGNIPEAKRAFQRTLELKPDHAEAQKNLEAL